MITAGPWRLEAPPPLPAGNEVHLWWAALAAVPEEALRWLGPAEAERAERIADPEAARERATARAAVRAALGAYLGCPPEAVRLETEAMGRPVIPGGPPFSVAHAGGRLLLAVAAAAVGTDLEPVRPRRWGPVAARFLGREGTAAVAAASDPGRAFLRAWCRLEAWAKARGTGIRFGLPVPPRLFHELDGATRIEDGGRTYHVVDLDPEGGFVGAVAVEGAAEPRLRWFWPRG